MSNCLKVVLALFLTAVVSTVSAEEFRYSAVIVQYGIVSADVDGINEDLEGDGVGVSVYVPVTDNVVLAAGASTASADLTESGVKAEVDADVKRVGVLYHTPASDTTDLILTLAFMKVSGDVTINNSLYSSSDDNGNSVSVGFRTKSSEKLEFNGSFGRTSIDGSSSTGFGIGAEYLIAQNVSLDLGYSHDEDADETTLSVLVYF